MSKGVPILRTPGRNPSVALLPIERGLALIMMVFIALATVYNLIIPPYENLDELEHAEVIRHIAVTGRLPIHDLAEIDGFHVRQEASQPPLYYILAAGGSRLLGLSDAAHTPAPVPDDLVACGLTGPPYNKLTWEHRPYTRLVDRDPARITIHALRAFSTLLQLATVVGVWTLARRAFPTGLVPALATGIVALNPQFLLLAAGVNNDNAVIPLATWGLILAFDMWDRELSWRRTLAFGAISGLAALSKLSGAAVLGLGGLALLVRLLQRKSTLAAIIPHVVTMSAIAIALVAPWAVRNTVLYGDPTALAPMLAKVGRRSGGIALGEARLMTLSYWGQLPCAFYPRALYWPFLALLFGGLLGVIAFWRKLRTRQQVMIRLCVVWFSVITVAWIRWGMMTAATGGRLLFPAIAALAVILATGWSHFGTRMLKIWIAALSVWAIVVLIGGPIAIVAPPARVTPLHEYEDRTEAAFDDAIVLRDYQAQIVQTPGRCFLVSSAYCGQVLDVSLVWQATADIDRNLILVLQLVSAEPGATNLRFNYNYWPGRGNLPTSAWPIGPQMNDRYLIPLPASDAETQAWRLVVAYVDPGDRQRLPVTINGDEIGDSFPLSLVRVTGQQPVIDPMAEFAAEVAFAAHPEEPGRALLLRAAQATPQDDQWTVDLFWECAESIDVDAIIFVHAYDEEGAILAAGDGPPKRGAFPTSLWEPGDRIHSQHSLSLDPDADPDTIAVGLYLPESGQRLPATQGDNVLPNAAFTIWPRQP
jgi:4-amino-4-deoxy-L-arabinose transferase-like glycosyltransferase